MEIIRNQTGGELLRTVVWICEIPLKSVLEVQVLADCQIDYDREDHLSAIPRKDLQVVLLYNRMILR